MSKVEGKEINITPLFKASDIVTDEITIVETPGMYPYKSKIEDNWAYFTAVGLKEFKKTLDKKGVSAENIGIVGIGSGVEAIAVLHLFRDGLKKVVVTDIDEGILEGTMYNLSRFSKDMNIEITPAVGSFCEPMENVGYKVDFVHANVPNLPSDGSEDLTQGAEKGTFVPAPLYEGYEPPQKFVNWALGAQFAYLESAKKVLKDGGSVITELGGRFPLELARELFDITGYEFQEVIVGFKEQTEALIDFIGYHRMEKDYEVTFEFYLYEESKNLLNEKKIKNPTSEISGDEMKKLLEPFKVSAGEALDLYHKGVAVGHTVHLFRGIKK